jgi:penicillin-binding protein 1C
VFEWFTRREAAELAYCEMHERVAIDPRNGLRAGTARSGGCLSVTRTFERFPPRFTEWAIRASRPVAPLDFSRDCPGDEPDPAREEGSVAIRYPLDGARFVIDPDRPKSVQVLAVSVVAPEGTPEVTLLVDGAEFGRAKSPYTLRWPLTEGDHDLLARAGSRASAPVTVHVRP